jgi:hypothetical protein
MQESPTLAMLLTVWAIASQSAACGLMRSGTDDLPVTGGTNGEGGSDPGGTGGGGGVPSSGGSPPMGGSTGSEGGSGALGGTAGAGGATAGAGGATAGAGGATAGAGGATAGAGGATAGAGGATAGAGGATAGAGGATAGAGGAASRIILFDGSHESFNDWVTVRNLGPNPWRNNGDGTMTVVSLTGDIQSKQKFRNVFVHLEYLAPQTPGAALPQMAITSGVFLHGSYGLRITDSHGLPPTVQSCGSVYGFTAPLEVACHERGVWNTYEIEFQAPTCDDDPTTIVTPARFVEVTLNDTLIHRNVDVLMQTQAGQIPSCEPRGLLLQDIGSLLPVSFRNIWAIARN